MSTDIYTLFLLKKIILPTTFECKSCNLTINGYSLLHAAGLGDQYTVEETYDPIEYYNIEFDPRDYFEPDYGND